MTPNPEQESGSNPGSPGHAGAPPQPESRLEASLLGFGPVGILTGLVILVGGDIGALLALPWARATRTPWRELGLARPRSWLRTVSVGIVFGCALKFLLKAIVMPLLAAAPVNAAYHYLVGNRAALPGMILTVLVSAGLGEEIRFRGFLFERLGRLFGRGAVAKAAIVVLSAGLFALAHYPDQGRDGAVQGAITGLVFGTTFAFTGELWLLMIAHAAFDLTAVWIIYNDLETRIAHLVFK
jgi:membrane protease YdiL (CAAX protease family)